VIVYRIQFKTSLAVRGASDTGEPTAMPITETFEQNDIKNDDVTKTVFKIHSHFRCERSWSATLIPVSILLACLVRLDPTGEMDVLWLVSGVAIAMYVFETSSKTRDVEVSLTVCPLGVQRTTRTHRMMTHHPLLPKESIRDCIVTEHVGAFAVSSHVMIRVRAAGAAALDGPALIPAFPNATLSFVQCHSVMKQIQGALEEF
jgi:hypothetical protein